MSDTIENIQGEQTPENNTPQYTDVELKAIEMGWRPKEEFSGDEADFIDAKEFVGRKPLYDKIASQSKQLKNVTDAVEALKVHYSKVQETAYQKALKDLKNERRQAMVEGDAEKFEALDEQITATEKEVEALRQEAERPIVKQEAELHPEFAAWKARNTWYDTTGYMKAFADDVGARLARTGMQPAEVLREVEKAVKAEFPQKFVNSRKADAPDVGDSKPGGRTPKTAEFELTEQERKIMNTLIRSKTMTKEQYIADLKEAKGVK